MLKTDISCHFCSYKERRSPAAVSHRHLTLPLWVRNRVGAWWPFVITTLINRVPLGGHLKSSCRSEKVTSWLPMVTWMWMGFITLTSMVRIWTNHECKRRKQFYGKLKISTLYKLSFWHVQMARGAMLWCPQHMGHYKSRRGLNSKVKTLYSFKRYYERLAKIHLMYSIMGGSCPLFQLAILHGHVTRPKTVQLSQGLIVQLILAGYRVRISFEIMYSFALVSHYVSCDYSCEGLCVCMYVLLYRYKWHRVFHSWVAIASIGFWEIINLVMVFAGNADFAVVRRWWYGDLFTFLVSFWPWLKSITRVPILLR